MRLVVTIFWILLAFFVLWIFSLNVGQAVQIDLFFTEFEQVNLITVTFVLLFIGFAFGILFFLIQLAKSKKEHFQLKKQINTLLVELSDLKGKSNDIKAIESSEENDDNTSDNPITEK
jgi:lipopolysaccharide assembly LapA-like protein